MILVLLVIDAPREGGVSVTAGGRPFCEATENGSACELHTANGQLFRRNQINNAVCEQVFCNPLHDDRNLFAEPPASHA